MIGSVKSNPPAGFIASVLNLPTTVGYSDGQLITVKAPRAMVLRYSESEYTAQSGGLSPDNLRTFAGALAGSMWIRDVDLGMPGATDFLNWYVDSVAGNDNNDGVTALTPVKHIEEVLYRLGKQPIGNISPTINLAGDFSAGSKLLIAPYLTNDQQIYFVGTKTVLATYTVTTVAWNEASGIPGNYTLSGAPNLTALGYVGKFIRVNGGPRDGWKATIASTTGSGVFIGNWADVNNLVAVEPVTGDTVQVYDTTKLPDTVIAPTGETDFTGNAAIYFFNCQLGTVGGNHVVSVCGGNVYFIGCEINGFDVLSGTSYCELAGSRTRDFHTYGFVSAYAHTFSTNGGVGIGARPGGSVHIDARCLVQGTSVETGNVAEGPGSIICNAPLFFNGSGAGNSDVLFVYPESVFIAYDYLASYNGTGSGTTYRIFSGGALYYNGSKKPAATGTTPTNFAIIGGTTKLAITIPYIEITNNATMVVYA